MSHEIKLNGFWYKPDDRIAKMTLEQCLDHAENAITWDERGDSITILNDCINHIRELTRWIPVEERLPTGADVDENGEVMAYSPDPAITVTASCIPLSHHFTHWRRIDKP